LIDNSLYDTHITLSPPNLVIKKNYLHNHLKLKLSDPLKVILQFIGTRTKYNFTLKMKMDEFLKWRKMYEDWMLHPLTWVNQRMT